ncbi:MAG: hypothetical protein GY747_04260 [Planctomycetes bacterium]|nr:hypothetical protein [Planctomycetota bacterium]MCP4770478.1 hypothetical protein [Planctomycetota bacterium]MCP4859918.1 hypothetical protein [Planctomycetota bacterium]
MSKATAWKWMPAVFLGAVVIFAVWRVMMAVDDPHFSAVSNAYEKAGQWDAQQAELAASKALGWDVVLIPGAAQAEGESSNTLKIVGPDGIALEGLTGEVQAFHNAYPKQVFQATLVAGKPGSYSFDLPLRHSGQWRWQFRLQHGSSTWVGEKRELVFAGGAQ